MLKPAKSRASVPPPKPGCVLAFGKHPGWEDHAEDVGTSSPALAKLKQHLYNQAIAGVIDQGRWQSAHQPGTTDASTKAAWPYGHEFIAWIDGAFVAGIIMPSRDARQRDRYPLILAMHLEPYPSKSRLAQVFRELRQVHTVAGTKDEKALRAAVAAASSSLAQHPPADEPLWSARSAQQWAEPSRWPEPAGTANPNSLAAPTGLLRSLYELSRELSAPGAGEIAQQLRGQIPAGTSVDSAAELPLWIAAVWAVHGSALPVMAIKPMDHAVVDVVIGLPDAATIWPIRQDLSSAPPASEVPYMIEPADQQRLTALVSSWKNPGSGASMAPESGPRPSISNEASRSVVPAMKSSKGPPVGLIVAGVVVGLAVLAVIGYFVTR
jgi:hypothetical protein